MSQKRIFVWASIYSFLLISVTLGALIYFLSMVAYLATGIISMGILTGGVIVLSYSLIVYLASSGNIKAVFLGWFTTSIGVIVYAINLIGLLNTLLIFCVLFFATIFAIGILKNRMDAWTTKIESQTQNQKNRQRDCS